MRKKPPSDLEILEAIYEMYYSEFKSYSQGESNRSSKVYVPIDIESIAKRFSVDSDIIFGRLYNYLEPKYGYTQEDRSKVPFFALKVGSDTHTVHFPLLSSVMTQLREEKNKQNKTNKISIISIVISIIAIASSTIFSRQSTLISREALKVANEANNIAIGRNRILPKIKVADYPRYSTNFIEPNIIKQSEFLFTLMNIGEVPIDQISIEIIALDYFSYSHSDSGNKIDGLGSMKKTIDFDSQLESGGFIILDLKSLILEFLKTMNLPNNEVCYTMFPLTLIFSPRQVGDDLPIHTLGNTENDAVLISIDFAPEIFINDEIINLIQDDNISFRIYNSSPIDVP